MSFPGCMHCLWHDGDLRTLRTAPLEQRATVRDYYYPDSGHARRLFPKILPDFAGIDDYDTEDGFCVDGFGNTACPLDLSASSRVCCVDVFVVIIVPVIAVMLQLL